MKTLFLKSISSIIALTAGANLPAAEADQTPMNEFRLGPSFGFNVTAKFLRLQGSPPATSPAAGPLVDRNYPDGYVHVDSSGNSGNQTWNWGYQNNAQYNATASTINMHNLSVNKESSPAASDDPNYGFELSYLRRLVDCGPGYFSVELAFGYNRLEVTDNSSHPVSATVTTDSFPLGAVIPPFAPYGGTFSGPGALLGATPTRATSLASGSISGSRSTDADIYCFRLGPVFTLPAGKKVHLELATGLAVAVVDNQFRYSETLTVSGISETRSGSGGGTDAIFGPYVRGAISYALSPSWRVFAGVQYQPMTDTVNQSAGGSAVELDFSQAIYATTGLSFTF